MLDFIGKWKDKITDYVDARVQLVKLELVERTSHILGFFAFTMLVTFMVAPVLLFIGMGMAEFVAEWTGSRGGAYFIVAGIYLVILILVYAGRKSLIERFTDMFISVMTRDNDKDEDKNEDQSTHP